MSSFRDLGDFWEEPVTRRDDTVHSHSFGGSEDSCRLTDEERINCNRRAIRLYQLVIAGSVAFGVLFFIVL